MCIKTTLAVPFAERFYHQNNVTVERKKQSSPTTLKDFCSARDSARRLFFFLARY